MRMISMLLIVFWVAMPATTLAQQPDRMRNADMWRAYADHIAIGSTLTIRTTAGERLTGVLFVVDDTAITVKPKTRLPEPARRVVFDRIEELNVRRDRVNLAKFVGIGAAVGAGVFVSMLAAATR
jgi:hypothetical protein